MKDNSGASKELGEMIYLGRRGMLGLADADGGKGLQQQGLGNASKRATCFMRDV